MFDFPRAQFMIMYSLIKPNFVSSSYSSFCSIIIFRKMKQSLSNLFSKTTIMVPNFLDYQQRKIQFTIKKSMIRGSKLMSGTRNSGTKHIMQTCGIFIIYFKKQNTKWKLRNWDVWIHKSHKTERILPYWN